MRGHHAQKGVIPIAKRYNTPHRSHLEERYGATVVVMKKIKRSVWHFSVSFVEGDKQRAEHAATIAILMKPAIPSPLRIAVRA